MNNRGPIKCSAQIDTIGRDFYRDKQRLYRYKNSVLVPPLAMIDNLVTFSICGIQAIVTNALVCSKIEMKKLEFGSDKCHAVHVGKSQNKC